MFPDWPYCTLTPRDVLASPSVGSARFGGRTMAGGVRTSNWSAGGLWRVVYEGIHIRTREQMLTAAAFDGLLDGGSMPVVVPRVPGKMAPDGGGLTPFSGGETFSGGELFSSVGGDTVFYNDALRSATTVRFTRPAGARRLIGGEDFEVRASYGPTMHRLVGITERVELSDGRVIYTAQIRVPLREPVVVGQSLFFHWPRCTMRMVNHRDFAAMIRRGRYGDFNAEFIEV